MGVIRAKGSMPSEKCIELINEHLNKYGLLMEKHVVAITTDGAKVMIKMGKLIQIEHQLCFSHGIHLAVTNVLYKKQNEILVTDKDSESELSNEDVDSIISIEEIIHTTTVEERHEIFLIIKKFEKSSKYFDNLQQRMIMYCKNMSRKNLVYN